MSCLFCNIIAGAIPSNKVYENDLVYAFEDISPQAPVHVLVVHRKHLARIEDLGPESASVMGDLFLAVKEIARAKGLAEGYRVIINNGKAGGQVIEHLHVHILGGHDDMGPMLAR
jgi:histidine triad (HIT) family protein